MYKMLPPEDIQIIVYHAHCIDGLTAAALSHQYTFGKDIKYEYIPMRAGEIPDSLLEIKRKNILFIDVAPKYTEYQIMVKNHCNVCILDHHITAKEELKQVPEYKKIFNMNLSGAMLSYIFFQCYEIDLQFILHVQDKELNTKLLGKNSDYLFQALCEKLNPITDSSTKIFHMIKYFDKLNELLIFGEQLEDKNQYYIRKIFNSGEIKTFHDNIVYVMHTETVKLCGEIGMYALDKLSDIDYSMVIYPGVNKNNENIHLFSLRSRKDFNVSDIAKKYGGGGHAQAAGFEIKDLKTFFEN